MVFEASSGSGLGVLGGSCLHQWGWSPLSLKPAAPSLSGSFWWHLLAYYLTLCFSNFLSLFSSVFREKVKIEELAFGGHCGWPVRGMMRWRTRGEGHTSDSQVARSSHVTSPWPCPWPRDLRRTCCGLAASWLGPVTCRRPPESSGRCWLWADGMGCKDPSPGRWWRTPPGLWFSPPSGNQPREPSFLQVPSSWPCKLRAPHPEPHGARPGTPSADRVSSCCLARRLTAWLVSGQQRSA